MSHASHFGGGSSACQHHHHHDHSNQQQHGSQASNASHSAHGRHGGCNPSEGDYSVGIHVGAVFILLLASVIGAILPILGNYFRRLRLHPFALVICKCVSTGVVMSVALLTMFNHSLHSFMEDCLPPALKPTTYDAFALLFLLISALLMHSLDSAVDLVIEGWIIKENKDAPDEQVEIVNNINRTDKEHETCGMKACGSRSGGPCECLDCPRAPIGNAGVTSACCGGRVSATDRLTGARRVMAVLLMQFGLVLHSIFLGLSVGIANDSDAAKMITALSFHQFFEGLALGSRLADASMRTALELSMVMLFSASTPFGVVIGLLTMTVGKSSLTGAIFVTLQAVTNSVGGGILLYIGFTLLLSDFPADLRKFAGFQVPHRTRKQVAMFLSLWVGAAVMAVLSNLH
uniref:Putative cation transporter n=1 Tax=Trypanosoma vivax (strain Y486) TaxID=1055687 RepID=G0UCB5_TRYVY|nr:putative cation transporter [Trypanosoma vivax Y486]